MGTRVVLGWNFGNPLRMKVSVSACSLRPVIRDGTLSWETVLRESHLFYGHCLESNTHEGKRASAYYTR